MFIDYIYLLLTIILICFIIFLIYLSYEYRQIEPLKFTEDFVSSFPPLKKMTKPKFDLYEYNQVANDFANNYTNMNTEIDNRDVTKDNIRNIKLYNKITQNLVNSQKIMERKNNLIKAQAPEQYPIDKLIKTIKSKYNAQIISTIGYDKTKYNIIANDKCLTVGGLCKEPYCLLDCQKNLYSSDSQRFKTERITNQTDAAKSMGTTLDKIASTNIYPFNIFKSLINSNCLTLTKEGITVEPCNVNSINQQWEISPDENICVLK